MAKCKKCGRNIGFFEKEYFHEDNKSNEIIFCRECNEKRFNGECNEKRIKSENEKAIEEQIKELEGSSGVVVILVILGIIGLIAFIIPGIIFFIIAAIVSSSRKSSAASLRAQLESIKQSKKAKSSVTETPLDVLKRKFAEGQITEEEYKKKKSILKE